MSRESSSLALRLSCLSIFSKVAVVAATGLRHHFDLDDKACMRTNRQSSLAKDVKDRRQQARL